MLDLVEKKMRENISTLNDETILKLFDKLPSGKRLRAKLVLRIAKDHPDAIMLASIIEMIHAASLLHDDVIDEATTRRGEESINALFGDKSAIMLGDVLYSQAFYLLTSLPTEVASTVSKAVVFLSIGELQDVELSFSFNSSLSSYETMIYNKTASLIEASAKAAALLAKKDSKAFATYGKNLGFAFQIIDDVLDVTQDSNSLGKPAMSDFKEGKTTLPYLYLYEFLNEKDQEFLKSLFKKELSEDELTWVVEKFKESKAIKKAVLKAKEYGTLALNAIKGSGVEGLEGVVKQMIERDF